MFWESNCDFKLLIWEANICIIQITIPINIKLPPWKWQAQCRSHKSTLGFDPVWRSGTESWGRGAGVELWRTGRWTILGVRIPSAGGCEEGWGALVAEAEEETGRASQAMKRSSHIHTGWLCPRAALVAKPIGTCSPSCELNSPWKFSFNIATEVKINLMTFREWPYWNFTWYPTRHPRSTHFTLCHTVPATPAESR